MADETKQSLHAVGLVCSLKPSSAPSSSVLMAEQVASELKSNDVECELIRCVDHAIAPGVENDMGQGDAWPQIREKVLSADILLISTPIWTKCRSRLRPPPRLRRATRRTWRGFCGNDNILRMARKPLRTKLFHPTKEL